MSSTLQLQVKHTGKKPICSAAATFLKRQNKHAMWIICKIACLLPVLTISIIIKIVTQKKSCNFYKLDMHYSDNFKFLMSLLSESGLVALVIMTFFSLLPTLPHSKFSFIFSHWNFFLSSLLCFSFSFVLQVFWLSILSWSPSHHLFLTVYLSDQTRPVVLEMLLPKLFMLMRSTGSLQEPTSVFLFHLPLTTLECLT